jgi:hypothetical protein
MTAALTGEDGLERCFDGIASHAISLVQGVEWVMHAAKRTGLGQGQFPPVRALSLSQRKLPLSVASRP